MLRGLFGSDALAVKFHPWGGSLIHLPLQVQKTVISNDCQIQTALIIRCSVCFQLEIKLFLSGVSISMAFHCYAFFVLKLFFTTFFSFFLILPAWIALRILGYKAVYKFESWINSSIKTCLFTGKWIGGGLNPQTHMICTTHSFAPLCHIRTARSHRLQS